MLLKFLSKAAMLTKNKHFVLISCFCAFFARSSFAQDTNQIMEKTNEKFTMNNCVNQFNIDDAVETKAGYQYWFVDKDFLDGRTLKLSVVAPNKATHAPHAHAEDEFFFVLEGTAEFHLNGKSQTAGPYTSFYCPPNSTHGIRNVGNTELKYLVIKKYNMK